MSRPAGDPAQAVEANARTPPSPVPRRYEPEIWPRLLKDRNQAPEHVRPPQEPEFVAKAMKTCVLSPASRSALSWTNPVWSSARRQRSGDRDIAVHEYADRIRAAADAAGNEAWRGLPQGGHPGGDVLQRVYDIKRADAARDTAAEATQGGVEALPTTSKLRKLVADPSLDQAMPQDALGKNTEHAR